MKKNFLKRLSLACVVVMVLSAALTGCSGGKKGDNPSDSVSETTGAAVAGSLGNTIRRKIGRAHV